MFDSACVGILGFSGTVGRVAAEYLSEKYSVIKGSRSAKADGKTTFQVDIYDAQALNDFCSRCKTVVNAAGPSYQIRDCIAKAAAAQGTCYVEAFGGGMLERLLQHTENRTVFGAGCVPGLSGIAAAYLAQESVENAALTMWYGGEECGGVAAVMDIILSSLEHYGIPDKELANGKFSDLKPPEIAEMQEGMPKPIYKKAFFTEEMMAVAKQYGLKNIRAYQIFTNPESQALLSDGCRKLMNCKEQKQQLAICKAITEEQKKCLAATESWFALTAEYRGENGKKKLMIRAKDSSLITGLMVGIAADWCMQGKGKLGAFWAFSCLDTSEVFSILRKYGVFVEEKTEIKQNTFMEYGEI